MSGGAVREDVVAALVDALSWRHGEAGAAFRYATVLLESDPSEEEREAARVRAVAERRAWLEGVAGGGAS